MEEKNKSEVARIKKQIEDEQVAASQGLHGLAQGVSRHEFITKRMERQGQLHDELKKLVGEEEAARILSEAMEGKSDDQDARS
jgi:hypothetical protein